MLTIISASLSKCFLDYCPIIFTEAALIWRYYPNERNLRFTRLQES